MALPAKTKLKENFFLRLHPLHRILLSLGVALVAFLFIRNKTFDWELTAAILWDAFSLSFIACSWVVIYNRPITEIIKQANKEDGSKSFVLVSILITSFASLLTVLLLIITKDQSFDQKIITVILSVFGMMISWVMVHTIFTFHYAHMYYFQDTDEKPHSGGLDFPGEKKPNYLDFAYFSFVVGMTFQVSDVQVSSPKIRKTVLAHGLLAFALNTFVVALTINLVAGLRTGGGN
jgi:uncharacterized membrane protein